MHFIMLTQKLLQHRNIFNSRLSYLLKQYSKQATASGAVQYEKTCFAPQRKKKPPTEPFIKRLIIGQVDEAMSLYPEVLPLDRFKDFFNWLAPIENYVLNCADTNKKCSKEEILNHLREYDVFQACMEEDYGLNLTTTESLKLIETVSTLPWLGTYLVKNNILPIKVLSKYGSASQKQEYYPKIMSGEIVPTICINEGDNGTNINNIKSYAVRGEGDTWLLNGKKTFVINGIHSNLYFVFARCHSKDSHKFKPDSFSLFLVEKDDKSVTCTEVCDTIGRHEVPTCTISFEDTVIPNKNVIGEPGAAFNILMELLKPGEQNIAAQAITILRHFTDQLIVDILKAKHFDRNLYEFDYVQHTLGKILFTLYTMESMAYFTSGLIDQYENQNVSIEKTITEKYCANKCVKSIETGMTLMGAHSYLNNTSYVQSFHDALALTTLDMNNLDSNTYIAASILKQIGKEFSDYVYKKRNYVKYPIFNMMDTLLNITDSKKSIPNYFHPSLKGGVEYFEDSINLFKRGINILLIQHGAELMQQYSSLERITDMITEIYAGFANLSRSSRSYCNGFRNTDIEKNIGVTMAYVTFINLNEIVQNLENEAFYVTDNFHKVTSQLAYEKHRYCIEHPLCRTLF
ncbi:complex I assembly factor ACAD9, mitochondrial-like isoform X1 [Osmia bicornis bicornis]|uniref:complex I assembly factor ACAD9, mitochondrial-like isoform X1 n=2 Tax=Osmia bicornis bicornis TaxID=1437191 RepID=UPI001EAEBD48|nr:complex I assembly factor ACAD9, mitochondrial-like isoform X1 [Osmia bicornis bicornis]